MEEVDEDEEVEEPLVLLLPPPAGKWLLLLLTTLMLLLLLLLLGLYVCLSVTKTYRKICGSHDEGSESLDVDGDEDCSPRQIRTYRRVVICYLAVQQSRVSSQNCEDCENYVERNSTHPLINYSLLLEV